MGRAVAGWASGAIVNRPGLPRLLIVASAAGCGKTTLAKAACRFWRACTVSSWARGHWGPCSVPSVQWADWSKLAELEPSEKQGIWADAEDAELLVIDDLGSEVDRFRSGLPAENLRLMLDQRHSHRGFTLITTNLIRREWSRRWDVRVTDRLLRQSHVIECTTKCSFAQRQHHGPRAD